MAYVRKRGRQLVIVHGERDPETKRVEQRILFTLYSKGEALEVLGKRENGAGAERFERLLQEQYPHLRFDWATMRAEIEKNLELLPDLYDYRSVRLRGAFRPAALGMAKALIQADPQDLVSAAELVAEHRYELEFVRELIDWRLRLCDGQKRNDWNGDNPFYWRFSLQGRDVPPEAEEIASEYWEKRDLDRAAAVFRLLTEAFQPYAEGHNYLGLIALERGDFDEAVRQFELTIELGRKLFPKRIAKKEYWSNHDTRPYMRGLRNLALVHNRVGRFDDALEICDRLDRECGDTEIADAYRASVYMNTGHWKLAAARAKRLVRLWPSEGFTAGFALVEQGLFDEARLYFLHAILNNPRAARIIAGTDRASDDPRTHVETDDHNTGVDVLVNLHQYFEKQQKPSARFFRTLLKSDRVSSLVRDVEAAGRSWFGNPERDRKDFEQFNRVRDFDFAKTVVRELEAV